MSSQCRRVVAGALLAATITLSLSVASADASIPIPAAASRDVAASPFDVQDIHRQAFPETFSPISDEPQPPAPEVLNAWVDEVTAALPNQDDPWAAVDACVLEEMADTRTPGASIAVAVDGEIVYTKGYGVKSSEEGGEIGPDTLFRIGSTTKMMTAAALLQLVESGDVDLQAPITTYLPDLEFQAPWRASDIAVHNLIAQDSGIPDQYLIYTTADFAQTSLVDWAAMLRLMPLNAPPGKFWNYSNPNFSLAGLIVQTVSGVDFSDYVEEHVWRQAGMPLSTFKPDVVRTHGDYSVGHAGESIVPPEYSAWSASMPAGSAWSTPTELVKWTLALMEGGGEVLSSSSALAMQSPQADRDLRPWQYYGYGIFITDYADVDDPNRDVTVLDHGGNVLGYSSQLFWVPERRMAVSILANTVTSLSGSAHCALREVARVQPKSSAGLTTPPETWDVYEGTYAMMNQVFWDYTAEFRLVGDHLVMSYLDLGGAIPLVQVLPNTFMPDTDGDGSPDGSMDLTFIRDEAQPDDIDWARYRYLVGERVGEFPDKIEIVGDSCAAVGFTSDIETSELQVRASGLVPAASEVVEGETISQNDPQDPTTAGYKHDIMVEGEAGLFFVALTPQQGTNLELYLLSDENSDGEFSYPDELIATGLTGSNNMRILLLSGRQPAGAYQLWVHGTSVPGNATFRLDIIVADGTNLAVADAPQRVSQGESYQVEVCAADTSSLDAPMMGLVEFSYGYPPRRVRVPVQWQPSDWPTPEPTATSTPMPSPPSRTPTPVPTGEPDNRIYLPLLPND